MKKLGKLLVIAVLLGGVFMVSGCDKNKKALTAEEFKTKIEAQSLEVMDVTEYMSDTTIKSAQYGLKTNAYQLEFYVSEDEKSAKAGYEQYIANLEAVAGADAKKGTETTGKNYDKYVDTNGDYYSLVIRVDNTYLYSRTAKENQKDVEKVVKELGY